VALRATHRAATTHERGAGAVASGRKCLQGVHGQSVRDGSPLAMASATYAREEHVHEALG
jgi:hypothetical protein